MTSILRPLLFAAVLAGTAASSLPCAQPESVQHVIVYHEAGRFGAWPANNAIWSWGNEIAVGFTRAYFKDDPERHSNDDDKPTVLAIAHSRDGGLTWTFEDHPEFSDRKPTPSPGNIEFDHPDFAMRVRGRKFFVSYDRAHTWEGPYALPDFGFDQKLSARTDYIVNGKRDCHIFISVEAPEVQAGIRDRAFAIRTRDGGKTFDFLGWMAGDDPPLVRSVMPATVRAADGTLVTLLRRRFDLNTGYDNQLNWIDAYGSRDDGVTWGFLARIAFTDTSMHNGNPPSLVRLPDDRLVAVYGVRAAPFGIRARISDDHGVTWGPEFILRDDARTWDIGYCRSVVRPDGKIVTCYYYATDEHYENHIAATIWSPPAR